MRTVKYILQFLFLLMLVVGGIYFGSENTDSIRIVVAGNLSDPIPIWFVVLIAFFVGAALSGLYFSVELVRLWIRLRNSDRGYRSKGMSKGSGGFKYSDSGSGGSSSGTDPHKPKFGPFGSTGSTSRTFGAPPPPPSTLGGNNNR